MVTLLALGNTTVAAATASSLRSSDLAAANTAWKPTAVSPVIRDLPYVVGARGTTLIVELGSYDFTVVQITLVQPLPS